MTSALSGKTLLAFALLLHSKAKLACYSRYLSKSYFLYPEETKIEKDTYTWIFFAALFTIARTWKQLRCPSTEEWIKKLQYIYTMQYYSDIKRNTFESVLMRWMNLEPIIQSEVSQKEKYKYHILTHIYGIQKYGDVLHIWIFALQI